jgi:hypothetical protein
MAGTQELAALAALAGRTVVAAAVTEAWTKAKAGFARLLGRGDQGRAELAERRLEETREQLAAVTGTGLQAAQALLAAAWQTRLADLLEEDPSAAVSLQVLVAQIQAEFPAGTVTASGHGAAAGRDMSIQAAGGGVAAGTILGDVSPGNPTVLGPAAS